MIAETNERTAVLLVRTVKEAMLGGTYMERRLLAVGDIVAPSGCAYLCRQLPALQRRYEIDFTVVNGEKRLYAGAHAPAGGGHL